MAETRVPTDSGARSPRQLLRWQIQIFSLLWTGYASYYLCRLNFAVAQPLILEEFPTWTAAQVGLIPSVYAAVYAVGQFVNGQLGERLGARRMMTAAMAIAFLSNLLFSMTSSYPLMLLLWGINGYAQSAGWSLVVKTMSNWTSSRRRGLIIGLISTCYQIGNVLAWLLAGWLAGKYGWRATFYVPALIILPVAVLFAVGIRNEPEDAGFPPVREDLAGGGGGETGPTTAPAKLSAAEVLRLTLTNRLLWILAIGFFCANAVRYSFMNWAVTYMKDFHHQDIKKSAFMSIALPLIGAVGAVSAGWISDNLFGKRRAPVCAVMLLGLSGVCVAFAFVPEGAWPIATAMLGLAGFLIYGPDMLMSGAATVDFSHPRAAAAATGFTMATGAAGTILSGAGIGWLKDVTPGFAKSIEGSMPGVSAILNQWTLIFFVLAVMAAIAASLMISIWNAKPKG
jgi:sugar phosphate permease